MSDGNNRSPKDHGCPVCGAAAGQPFVTVTTRELRPLHLSRDGYVCFGSGILAGATADDWCLVTAGDAVRFLTWSRHDTARVGVAVDGTQHDDGRVESHISLYDTDGKQLSAYDARDLAAALLAAADELEALAHGA